MSDTVTVCISIGRGAHVAQQPLSADDWRAFRNQVRTILTEVIDGTVHVDDAQSVGEWNGVSEDSATFVAEVPQQALSVLRAGLRLVGRTWGQEAIALTIGQTEFVSA